MSYFLLKCSNFKDEYVYIENDYIKNSQGEIAYIVGRSRNVNSNWWPPAYYGNLFTKRLTTDPVLIQLISHTFRCDKDTLQYNLEKVFKYIEQVTGCDIREEWDFGIYFISKNKKWKIVSGKGLTKL